MALCCKEQRLYGAVSLLAHHQHNILAKRNTSMKKLFVGNLPASTKDKELIELFSQYGKVRSLKLATDIFTNQCKGFGFIEMEGHEARAAITGLNGKTYNGKTLKVNFEDQKKVRKRR